MWVVKRSGEKVEFDREKIAAGVRSAAKNRPVAEDEVESLVAEVEDSLRELGSTLSSEKIGWAVLERLRKIDDVSYLRFASVYKGFTDAGDFEREVGLLTKSTEPKSHL